MIYTEQQMSKSYANQDQQLKKEEDVEQLIAQNIIRRRKKLGLTQKQMADQLNTQQSVVSRIETGNHNLTIANLKGIAQVLETDVSSLVARGTGLTHKRYKLVKR
ncbi:helix-turn-helix transcriptional regulator [Domibacillus sp. DTU_2020_1001157_1_SI_ALB_TIR_016]|uniref:helix-turn-helix domain-containing protein n=1 Tax=Domibacillus sp. DTU_2020_1001157_1_SI_ALB_TIR_016 TaxID=3077789 RepID=UPI0028EA2AB2|nr:helix-turn-helix transcriptional regulator [Domibacillus sp. DTU_2020_1001157_1_SI_ALB_TIR_016]WNS78132.1 helix-turn-helix transcriptional regulator [Domibacillus sp. DTU_2020_1001157_1_SI_ALB_TIR_016]